ncbi:TPA: hypothetical protein RFT66_005538, partial [Klebsiella pneumoniae subsp. pneumoniae]|nr:hypothetical protein [Klebsiella pneumoniae subsp. pneumoniae]
YQISKLVSDNTGVVDNQKVKSRISELEKEIKKMIPEKNYIEEKNAIYAAIDGDFNIKKYISGKDYLLPLIITRMKSIVNTRISNITLKHRISQYCSIDDINDIENYIFLP